MLALRVEVSSAAQVASSPSRFGKDVGSRGLELTRQFPCAAQNPTRGSECALSIKGAASERAGW